MPVLHPLNNKQIEQHLRYTATLFGIVCIFVTQRVNTKLWKYITFD